MKHLLLLVTGIILLASCDEKPCETFGIMGVTMTATNNKLHDTLLTVKRYKKGSNFLEPIDSASAGLNKYMTVVFDSSMKVAENYNYDCLCKVMPSGTTFKISDIYHGNEKGKPGLTCVNTLHYNINGKPIEQKGYYTMHGYMMDLAY